MKDDDDGFGPDTTVWNGVKVVGKVFRATMEASSILDDDIDNVPATVTRQGAGVGLESFKPEPIRLNSDEPDTNIDGGDVANMNTEKDKFPDDGPKPQFRITRERAPCRGL